MSIGPQLLFPSLQPNKARFSCVFEIERSDRGRDHCFFSSLDELQAVTLNLQVYPNRFACHNCQRSEHFVSRGFSYTKARAAQRVTVEKRLFCADRFGRGGGVATLRLYLTARIPSLHVGAAAMQPFLMHLETGSAVESAYADAVDDCKADAVTPLEPQTSALLPHRSSRNAWRWLKKLDRNLPRFRALLCRPDASACLPYVTRSARLRLLLPGFVALRSKLDAAFVGAFQCTQQAVF